MMIGTATRTTLARAARLAPPDSTTDRELLRRYVELDDEAAFAAVVRRHTAMVLGVCTRALHSAADAEDACQAVFVVMANKAGRVAWQASVANWLYATARKVSAGARLSATRRTRRESAAAVKEAVPPADTLTGPELVGILDEELDRLPPRYREPLVLCYLEGLTRDEAAARLGVSDGALKKQLERGRAKLAAALSARGCGLGVALLLTAATSSAKASSPRLLESILASAGGQPSAAVAALVQGVAVGTWKSKAALAVAVLFGVTAATTVLTQGAGADDRPAVKVKPADEKPKLDAKPVTVTGTVLDPDGKPAAGAKIWIRDPARTIVPRTGENEPAATTDADGKFTIRRDDADNELRWNSLLLTTADGFGPGFARLDQKPGGKTAYTCQLRLVKDDVPVRGRVVDLQGKGVAGATVRVVSLYRPEGNLDVWMKAVRQGLEESLGRFHEHFPHGVHVGGVVADAKTDADGKFTVTGLGRERLTTLRIFGPTIATEELSVMTRAVAAMRPPADKLERYSSLTTFHGATFDLAAEPGQPFVGTVTDKVTGKPIPGVLIKPSSRMLHPVETVTDANGKYRLDGLNPGEHELVAVPPLDSPYHLRLVEGGRAANQQPVTLNFELHRGTWVRGKVTDKATGRPISGAISYRPYTFETGSEDISGYTVRGLHDYSRYPIEKDGSFRVLAAPGKGFVFVYANGRYLTADQVDWQGDVGKPAPKQFVDSSPVDIAANWNAIGVVTVTADKPKQEEYAFTVDPGATLKVKLVDGDGKPVTGTLVGRRRNMGAFDVQKQDAAEVEFVQVNPKYPRSIVVIQPERHLGALFRTKPSDGAVSEVKLSPTATARGRLLSDDGKPLANAKIEVQYSFGGEDGWRATELFPTVTTDAEGKFVLPNLIEGLKYNLRWPRGGAKNPTGYHPFTVKQGEEAKLGDVSGKREE